MVTIDLGLVKNDAAQRNRYARAVYYCSITKDIHTYINEEEKFNQYYNQIHLDNNRRPALKDEMKKRIFICPGQV